MTEWNPQSIACVCGAFIVMVLAFIRHLQEADRVESIGSMAITQGLYAAMIWLP